MQTKIRTIVFLLVLPLSGVAADAIPDARKLQALQQMVPLLEAVNRHQTLQIQAQALQIQALTLQNEMNASEQDVKGKQQSWAVTENQLRKDFHGQGCEVQTNMGWKCQPTASTPPPAAAASKGSPAPTAPPSTTAPTTPLVTVPTVKK